MESLIWQYAVVDGVLPRLFEAGGLEWDEAAGARMVRLAAAAISKGLHERGRSSYNLWMADGRLDETRVLALRTYLTKLVDINRAKQQQLNRVRVAVNAGVGACVIGAAGCGKQHTGRGGVSHS